MSKRNEVISASIPPRRTIQEIAEQAARVPSQAKHMETPVEYVVSDQIDPAKKDHVALQVAQAIAERQGWGHPTQLEDSSVIIEY